MIWQIYSEKTAMINGNIIYTFSVNNTDWKIGSKKFYDSSWDKLSYALHPFHANDDQTER